MSESMGTEGVPQEHSNNNSPTREDIHAKSNHNDNIAAEDLSDSNAGAPKNEKSATDPHQGQNHTVKVFKLQRERKKCERITNLVLRSAACILLFLSFVTMAANKHNNDSMWYFSDGINKNFDHYVAYKYLLAITVIAFAYSAFQTFQSAYNLVTKTAIIPEWISAYIDFICDQISAYLLISCSSGAGLLTTELTAIESESSFTEMAGASVSMAFLGFALVAASALVSGYRLSYQLCKGHSSP